MQHIRQIFSQKGTVQLKRVDLPLCSDDTFLVQVHYSFVSSGTEGATVANSGKSLLNRFTSNVAANTEKVLDTIKEHGVGVTLSLIHGKTATLIPLGYSCAGQVIAVGKNIQGFCVGDYVACAGSGIANHADIVAVPQNLAAKITDTSYLKQASIATIGTIAVQGIRRASLQLGERVCVIGLGLIGQLTVQLAKQAGCTVFGVDLQGARLELARKLGADKVFDASSQEFLTELAFATQHHGVDATVITAASSSGIVLQQAMQMTRRKGRVVLVGDVKIDIDRDPFYSKEIDFLMSCSYGPGRYDDVYERQGLEYPFAYVRWTEQRNMAFFVDLIQQKKIDIDALISHEVDVTDAHAAYQQLQTSDSLGLVLFYHPAPENTAIAPVDIDVLNKNIVTETTFCPYHITRESKVNVAVVGAGGFSKVKLLPIIAKLPALKIHTIVDQEPATAFNVAHQYGAPYTHNNYQKVLADDSTHAVIVATPHHLHAEQATQLMNAGKAVFVEKPAAVTFEQYEDLKHFLETHKNEVAYCVDFNRSYAPFMHMIKDVIKQRTNPMVIHYRMNAGYVPKTHWMYSSLNRGRIIGEGCHIFELFGFLTDAVPKHISVQTLASRYDDIVGGDNFTATITMGDGSCCSFTYTSLGNSAMGKERMEVFVDGKSIVMDNFTELCGYGMPMSFNRLTKNRDQGHEQLLTTFFNRIRQKPFDQPISYERILQATYVSLVVDTLARAGGGQEAVSVL